MSNLCVCKFFDKGGKLIISFKLILLELYDFYIELYFNCDLFNYNNVSDVFLDYCYLLILNEDVK